MPNPGGQYIAVCVDARLIGMLTDHTLEHRLRWSIELKMHTHRLNTPKANSD
ncbi:MAG: hypothetical protein OXE56_00380 [Gammaproteobacteria bacterium]|nr:hypothetical protein [Gammaproteobacteria bacterium]